MEDTQERLEFWVARAKEGDKAALETLRCKHLHGPKKCFGEDVLTPLSMLVIFQNWKSQNGLCNSWKSTEFCVGSKHLKERKGLTE